MKSIFTGRVQGIGFRFFVSRVAQRLGLCGWVKNNPDGSVSLTAQGKREDLIKLSEEIRRYSPIRIQSEQTAYEKPTIASENFKIL